MKKISIERNYLIITIIMLILVVIGGTFAWFTYRSKETALVLSIGDINDSRVIIKPYQIRKTLAPVNVYTSGVYSQITAINNNTDAVPLTFFYKINELDEILINNGLKYTVVSSNSENGTYTQVVTGDFSDVLNNQLVVLETEIAANTTTYYRIYVWLDSSVANQNNVVNSVLNIELNGSIDTVVSFDDHTLMITSYTCNDSSGNPVTVGDNPYFTYTGQCEVIDDGEGDWRIRFLTDGIFTSSLNIPIDVFLVGGGGGGGVDNVDDDGGGGGGGGYTTTTFAYVKKNTSYNIIIGTGGPSASNGGDTTGFGSIAYGGKAGNGYAGGSGGSGGGGGSFNETYNGGSGAYSGGSGGSDGGNGSTGYGSIGTGQGTTTREFGEDSGDLYSGGGGGGAGLGWDDYYTSYGSGGSGGGARGGKNSVGSSASDNTGGGGGGGAQNMAGGSGGSGIVVIRNYRGDASIEELPGYGFDFTYTDGYYSIVNEGTEDWKIKFLTSGTFVSNTDLSVDAFLVGGGGGGGVDSGGDGGGGGAGGKTTTSSINISKNTNYSIVIGSGGQSAIGGETTSGFGITALGGGAGSGYTGGSGGSGGGGGGYTNSYTGGNSGGTGGSYGGAGSTGYKSGGTGQGTTTCEFGEGTTSSCTNGSSYAYSGGGGGGAGLGIDEYYTGYGTGGTRGGGTGGKNGIGGFGVPNTGGGGGGSAQSYAGGTGGSGILIIRNARD